MDAEDGQRLVKMYLSAPHYCSWSNHQRVLALMGDRVSVAIMKELPVSTAVDDLMLRKLLMLVWNSFAWPTQIQREGDREPSVTEYLLEALVLKRPDQEEAIRAVLRDIRTARLTS